MYFSSLSQVQNAIKTLRYLNYLYQILENKGNLLTRLFVFNKEEFKKATREKDVRNEKELYAQIFHERENTIRLVPKPLEEKERCDCFQQNESL